MQRNSLLLIVILETEFLKWSNYEDSHIGSQKFRQLERLMVTGKVQGIKPGLTRQ